MSPRAVAARLRDLAELSAMCAMPQTGRVKDS
jgi:hypothetical protein